MVLTGKKKPHRKVINLLTDNLVRSAKPREKDYKLFDGGRLFLLVATSGSKYWRYKYEFAGKEKLLALGVYPDVSLAEAREARDKARKQIKSDVDPNVVKKLSKQKLKSATENSFQAVTYEWIAKHSTIWDEEYSQKMTRLFERDIFPWIGKRPVDAVEAPELLEVLLRIEKRTADTAHRAQQSCSRMFRYAIVTHRAKYNPSVDLRGALQPIKKKHFPTITDPVEIGGLLRSIDGYQGYFATQYALKLAPRTFVRPGELRFGEWTEFNFELAEWRIPAERMKMKLPHIVPLSTQAIALLKELYLISGDSKYLFPSIRTTTRPISENTVNAALRRLGYTSDEMTGHGFRSMASTLLNEEGWNSDAVERQLAHVEPNSVRAAYNYAEYLPERRKMMQYWSDCLDSLAKENKLLQSKIKG